MKPIRLLYILLAAVTLGACHGKDHGESTHHHDERLMVTAYSDDFELFAEVTPLAAGHEAEITAHFTHLPGFTPLEKGTVTATLTVGGASVSQTQSEPAHAGIYIFALTPPHAGAATLSFKIVAPGGESMVTAKELTVYADEHEAEEAAEEAEISSSNGVAFSKAMSWKSDFATEEVQLRPMAQIIHTMGRVEPSQGDVRTLTAKASGIVLFAVTDLTDGRNVAAGQALFRIDASATADQSLRVQVAQARSNFQKARDEYQRKEELAKEKLATRSELLAAKNEYENAKATYDHLERGYASGAVSVSSPISGYLTSVSVTNGQYVEAGAPLATVAQTRHLFIRAEIAPSYYTLMPTIKGVGIRHPNSDEYHSMTDLHGEVVSYGKALEPGQTLLPVIFRVDNTGCLMPGAFVDMHLMAGEPSPVVAVPSASLIEEMGNYFVYAQLTPEYFEKREVKTGRTDGIYTEILSGIEPGERVVSKGAVLVKLAHASGAIDPHSGHVH